MNLLVTGGCGFIGSNFIHYVIKKNCIKKLINFDCLSYAADLDNVHEIEKNPKYALVKGDLKNFSHIFDAIYKNDISHVVHLAAETHVDNSIMAPDVFIESNIVGTFNLLKVARDLNLKRLHHVSTDEVYGELKEKGKFKETTPYDPRNPYAASKASADFLVRSYVNTYNLPATISNCSNNYGPRQHKEKLIPTIINSVLNGNKVPVYGKGLNIRDWIYVEDHCRALWKILKKGKIGETYNVGADNEKKNIDIVKTICKVLNTSPKEHIEYVEDRAGHDFRYAIDNSKIKEELKWYPKHNFKKAIKKTVKWYKSECK